MKALRSANFAKLSSSSSTSDVYWVDVDIGGHAGRILLEPDALHGISPLITFPLVLGRDALFWAVLSNAAADGKRLRAIDALAIESAGRAAEAALTARRRLRCRAGLARRFGLRGGLGRGFGLGRLRLAWPAWRRPCSAGLAARHPAWRSACLTPAWRLGCLAWLRTWRRSWLRLSAQPASGFLPRPAIFLPRGGVVCLSASAATAAIKAAPVLVGPV